ncbi:MAG: molybdopterin molybdotransferase MoeA [Acidobacteria bacterium]|nr:molybdopterin molybdotransferase MoeA [Acidobacteriota bacterium]
MTSDPISPEEAWRAIEADLAPLPSELVGRRRAWRRVLAADLDARVDVPPHDMSAMDGYAVAPALTSTTLSVAGTIAAGDRPGFKLDPATTVRIMTGAPIPTGADRVVPIELTDGGTESVELLQTTACGAHIRRRGEVIRKGELLLRAGTVIAPGTLAALATHGISSVRVHRSPTVAVMTTGDEVVPPSIRPRPGQIRDSHTDFLLAAGHDLGVEFDSLGIAADTPDALAERISRGMRSDVLIIGGGVSMGAFDWVESTLDACGCELLFHNVSIQPGKPLLAARHEGGLVFGLPGNPNAVMVTFALFVRPALRCLLGYEDGFWHSAMEGTLTGPLEGARGRDRFIPARLVGGTGRARLEPIMAQGSHDMNAFARADALVRVTAGSEPRAAGEPCAWQALEP